MIRAVPGTLIELPGDGRISARSNECMPMSRLPPVSPSQLAVRGLLDQGRLETVLDGWQLPAQSVHLVWPPGRQLPARTRAFIDFVAARWAVEPPG